MPLARPGSAARGQGATRRHFVTRLARWAALGLFDGV